MCFSPEADLVVGAALVPVAVLALREVRHRRELLFASLPGVFAFHQLVETLVWLGVEGSVSRGVQDAAALVYVLIAFPLLPTLLPLAVLLLEPPARRRRVAPFVGLGLVVSAYLLYEVLAGPLTVREESNALVYGVGLRAAPVWAVLYVASVICPALLSGYRSITWFGALNLVGLVVVALLLTEAFASVWCVYAALASVLVLVHLRRRRTLPDGHRLGTEPLSSSAGVRC